MEWYQRIGKKAISAAYQNKLTTIFDGIDRRFFHRSGEIIDGEKIKIKTERVKKNL